MSFKQKIEVEFSAKDAEVVRNALRALGEDGEKALKTLDRAGKEPSSGLKALDAASREAQGAVDDLASRAGPLGGVLRALGPAGLAAAAGIGAVTAVVVAGLREYAEAEQSYLRLEQVVRATGGAAKTSAAEIKQFADAMELRTFGSTAEAIEDAASALLTFKNVSGQTFYETMDLAADLSAVFKTDLQSSVMLLGKALNDPIQGLTALRRAGVSLTDDQEALIKKLAETGKLFEAQGIILQAVRGQVDGAASAINGGLLGAYETLKEVVGDAVEGLGESVAKLLSLEERLRGFAKGILEYRMAFNAVTGDKEELADLANKYGAILTQEEKIAKNRKENDYNQKAQSLGYVTEATFDDSRARVGNLLEDLEQKKQLSALGDRERATQQAINDARKNGIKLSAEDEQKIRQVVGQTFDLEKANRELNKTKKGGLDSQLQGLQDELRLAGLSGREQKIEQEVIRANNTAKQEGVKLTQAQLNYIRETVGSTYDLEEQQKKNLKLQQEQTREAERQLEAMAKPFIRAGEQAQEDIADMLDSMLEKGKFTFESLGDSLVSTIRRSAAEAAAALIFRPIIAPIVTGAASAFLGPQVGGVVGKEFGLSGGIGSISNLATVANSLMGGNGSIFGGFGSTLDTFGANYLGLSNVSSNFIGPLLPGQTAGATLSGLLGTAGLGAGIGGLMTLLTGGNSMGGSIGGGLGALAGNFLLPGIGGWLGGALGGAIGGLFGGGKPSSKLQGGYINLAEGGAYDYYGLTGKKFSQENKDAATTLLQSSQAIAGIISAATDKQIKDTLRVEVGSRNGIAFQLGGGELVSAGSDGAEALKSITSAMAGLVDVSDDVKEAIKAIDFTNLEKALYDLSIATGKAAKDFNQTISDQILQMTDPSTYALKQIGKEADELRKKAEEVKGDVNLVNQLEQLKIQQVMQAKLQEQLQIQQQQLQTLGATAAKAREIASNFGKVGESISKTLSSFKLSDLSVLSPTQKVDFAKSEFEAARAAALSEKTPEALAKLNDSALDYVSILRDVYASSTQYVEGQEEVTRTLEQAKAIANQQMDYQASIASAADQQVNLLQSILTALSKSGGVANDNLPPAAASLLRPSESASVLGGINSVNNLPESVVRSVKSSLGFNFGTATGSFADYARSNPAVAAEFNRQIQALGGVGQSFATGGLAMPGLALVGEEGPEIVRFTQQAQVYNASDTRRILTGANDNGAMIAELRGVRDALNALLNVAAASGDINKDGLKSLDNRLSGIERKARLQASA